MGDDSELTLLVRTVDVDIDRVSLVVVEEVVDSVRVSDPDPNVLLEETVDAVAEPEIRTSLVGVTDCEPDSVERAGPVEVESGVTPAAELPGVDSGAADSDRVSGTAAELSADEG